jgi:hypothetical protein
VVWLTTGRQMAQPGKCTECGATRFSKAVGLCGLCELRRRSEVRSRRLSTYDEGTATTQCERAQATTAEGADAVPLELMALGSNGHVSLLPPPVRGLCLK